jgi:ribosomal protein S27E
MSELDIFLFVPKPIDAVCIRPGQGTTIQTAIGTIQRIAAVRAYSNYNNSGDWMGKLSTTYVVAIATRSADSLLMQYIQNDLNSRFLIQCASCKNSSIGTHLIRERLFPTLKLLREHANQLLHHLDDPAQKGIVGVNVEGVYSYCYHLFQENNDALFGTIPNPDGKFTHTKCNKCRSA